MFRSETDATRFLCFAVVGATGFAVDAGMLALLHHWGGVDPFLARIVSIAASAFVTWRLNRGVTFGVSGLSQTAEGLRYAVVAGLAACLNYMIYALALTFRPDLPPVAAAVIATLVAMVFSYAGYSRFVFPASPATFVASPSSQRR
jgi:putative flippase GtrA